MYQFGAIVDIQNANDAETQHTSAVTLVGLATPINSKWEKTEN